MALTGLQTPHSAREWREAVPGARGGREAGEAVPGLPGWKDVRGRDGRRRARVERRHGKRGQESAPVARGGREAIPGARGGREAGDGRAGRERRRGGGTTTTIKH